MNNLRICAICNSVMSSIEGCDKNGKEYCDECCDKIKLSEKKYCYRVTVKTTNSLNNCTRPFISNKNIKIGDVDYYDCKNGILYIITNKPKLIYEILGSDTVISIEKIGIGYTIKIENE